MQISLITQKNNLYPSSLSHIYKPPEKLYIRGDFSQFEGIAVVGTRKISPYGRYCTELLTGHLVRIGMTIVSGLALGIDSIAHNSALDNSGRTIAVLGSGVDNRSIYPRTNLNLARKILGSGGCLISEYKPGTNCRKYHFPARNRIVAGIAQAVLVIEAPKRSGAMITARLAMESGKEVWAVPGPINHPNSEGVNWLISQGATPITSVDDLSHSLGIDPLENTELNLPEDEQKVASALKMNCMSIDQISNEIGVETQVLAGLMTQLEMKGLVRNLGDGRFTLYT